MMVLLSATAHLNSPIIALAVDACGEESVLMNPIPTELKGLPRFPSLTLVEAKFNPLLSLLPYHSSLFISLHPLPSFLTLILSHLLHSSGCPDMPSPPTTTLSNHNLCFSGFLQSSLASRHNDKINLIVSLQATLQFSLLPFILYNVAQHKFDHSDASSE